MASSSWIEIRSDCDFSLDNIPFGVASFNRKTVDNGTSFPRCCTAIGDHAVDLSLLAEVGLSQEVEKRFFRIIPVLCGVHVWQGFHAQSVYVLPPRSMGSREGTAYRVIPMRQCRNTR